MGELGFAELLRKWSSSGLMIPDADEPAQVYHYNE